MKKGYGKVESYVQVKYSTTDEKGRHHKVSIIKAKE